MAKDRNTDIVEVAPTATPPVCRLMNYGKYKYQQIKKERQARQSQKATQVREIRLRPKISPHDMADKVRLALRLLGEGNKVKVSIIFRGRENTHPELGWKVLQNVVEAMKDKALLERPPSSEGGHINIILAPLPARHAKEAKPATKEMKTEIKEPVNA
jgi:translation initiation factor IF-3